MTNLFVLADPQAERNRPVLAKHFEDEERVEQRSRWSVAESAHRCTCCENEIPTPAPIYTTLVPARDPSLATAHPDVNALFERLDYCGDCFEGAALRQSFAFWKRAPVPRAQPVRKHLNLAAIYAYFDYLGESLGTSTEAASFPLAEPDATEPVPIDLKRSSRALPEAEVLRLRYLLGLLLVRKRVFRWVGQGVRAENTLTLEDKKSGRRVDVTVPRETAAEIATEMAAFDDLFR